MTTNRQWPDDDDGDAETTVTLRLTEAAGSPPAATLGTLCRQLDVGYRLLAGESVLSATEGPEDVAATLAAAGGLSVTGREDLDAPLCVEAVAAGEVCSVRLVGSTGPLLGVLALCGATFGEDGSVADATTLEETLASLADGIGTLKEGLGSTA
jgi:hypothetical protein